MASIERIPAGRGRRRTGQIQGQTKQSEIAQSLGLAPNASTLPFRSTAVAGLAMACCWFGWNATASGQTLSSNDAALADVAGTTDELIRPEAAAGEEKPASSLGDFLRSIAEDIDRLSPDSANGSSDGDGASDRDGGQTDDGTDDEMRLGPDSSIDDLDASGAVTAAPEIDMAGTGEELMLADVVASLYRSYPEINLARQELTIAGGELTSAYGSFDTKFHAHSLSEPLGFYKNYRNGLGLARQTWWGGYLSAGYRIGRGLFAPWYNERATDDAGEFKVAFSQPLLQGRAIDPQRVAVFQASLAQRAAGPIVQKTILDISREATGAYWAWVSAGAVLQAQRELLELAIMRGEQFNVGVKEGKFAEIDLILNQQLIAERQAKLFETEQKFRSTSFKLSLYLRDSAGQPMVPDDAWLPKRFPVIEPPPLGNFAADLAAALGRRPEPQLLQFELQHVQYDRQLACNDMLPRLDFVSELSQDMGEPSSSPKTDDKGDFQLLLGITSEVPIQRRKARGKIQSTSAKMVQINEKIRLVRDKIGAELQASYANLVLAQQVVEQTEVSLRAAIETLDRYRFAFQQGKIDLIYLNLLETKANETEIKLVVAQQSWFAALAEMQISLGLDPLDQAMLVSALPPSAMPGPGNLPETEMIEEDAFNEDWKTRTGE